MGDDKLYIKVPFLKILFYIFSHCCVHTPLPLQAVDRHVLVNAEMRATEDDRFFCLFGYNLK